MENSIASLGQSAAFASQRSSGSETASQPRGAVGELLAPSAQGNVSLNQDIPSTSRIPEVNNQTENRTNRTNQAERAPDPVVQQQQIESFLAEQTGENAESFQGIDIETALELQESFRERPAQNELAASTTNSPSREQPVDANDQQNQELIQRLQSRLADQIPNDPGTEFPQLIETVA